MGDIPGLDDKQLDALREVANIGAAHAATGMSQITERTTMISVPEIKMLHLESVHQLVGGASDVVVAVTMQILGDLTGRIVLMLPDEDAHRLCDLLLHREPGTTNALAELERAALQETANIVGGAYMNAMSDFLGMMLLLSVPGTIVDRAEEVLTVKSFDLTPENAFVLCVETEFGIKGKKDGIDAHFVLLLDKASITAILDAIRVT